MSGNFRDGGPFVPEGPTASPRFAVLLHMLGKTVLKSGERQEVSVLEISVDKAEMLSVYECHAFCSFLESFLFYHLCVSGCTGFLVLLVGLLYFGY